MGSKETVLCDIKRPIDQEGEKKSEMRIETSHHRYTQNSYEEDQKVQGANSSPLPPRASHASSGLVPGKEGQRRLIDLRKSGCNRINNNNNRGYLALLEGMSIDWAG